MSDREEDFDMNDNDATRVDEDEEEEHEQADQEHGQEQEQRPASSSKRVSIYDALDDDDEDEDEDVEDDDDEDDDEDEDEGNRRGRKRAKHRHRKPAVNRFLDVEAEVDTEDEEEEDEEEDTREFIAEPGFEGDDYDINRRAAVNARLDRRAQEMDEQDLAKIAQNLHERYGRAGVRYTGDMNEVPQRLLMPSVHDASLWQIRVKPGRERDIVFSLMRKALDLEYTAAPLQILSAFQRDSLPGMVYVEARSAQQVNVACKGLVGVYPSRGIVLVPIEEMASLLQIKKQEQTVTPGSWVRVRRGKYQGDLAQVMDITENGEDVGLKFVPRIDLNPKDENSIDGRKRKKAFESGGAVTGGGGGAGGSFSMRPPQRFFNFEEVVKVYGRKNVSKRNQVYVFQNDTYRDGFIEKDFKLSALQLDNVNPSLDEITKFTRGAGEGGAAGGLDGAGGSAGENTVDLSIIAEASRKAAIAVLQPGDHVEVFEGEQSGVHGVVDSISQDVVTIVAVGVDVDGQKVDVPARSVRKRFKPGDHVKVMAGKNADETGLVVAVSDNVVTFLSDMSMQEVSVFSKDLREAAEVGSGTNIVGNYELHDLVQLDMQTVGVIFKTERDSFRVLDQNGQVRLVQPHQISMRRDSTRAIATDSEGHEIRVNDNMKEVDGEARKGRVLHVHQSFYAFLHNREIAENGGVFVTRTRALASLAPKSSIVKTGLDASKQNPLLAGGGGGMVGSGTMGRGPRDRDIGAPITVVQGSYKGYHGLIKDTNGTIARVELNTGNKVISIDKGKLRRRLPNGTLAQLGQRPPMGAGGGGFGGGRGGGMGPPQGGGGRTANPFGGRTPNSGWGGQAGAGAGAGGRTPAWGTSGRTPNPYASGDGRTPAWGTSGRTPNPYADGGKTPAWNANSRTPNPYADKDGGKTPAWNVNSRTPNPYAAAQDGGKTPAWNVDSRTPRHPSSGGGGSGGQGNGASDPWSADGAASPRWGAANNNDPWSNNDPWGAPTPAATAPTPAPTGAAAWSASTPAYNAPTPRDSGVQAYSSAPTPGGPGNYSDEPASAPTPAPAANDGDGHAGDDSWVNTSYLRGKRVMVQVSGTLADGWQGGEYEGRQGWVQSVLPTGFDLTAQVFWLPSGTGPMTVKTKYLEPVRPEEGDRAVMIGGEQLPLGTEVECGENTIDGWTVHKPQDSETFTVQEEELARVHRA
ncbi:transcription elongation factor Spt5 [Coniophora puteana RWD-64-598 SS2]|uniref:Transcription elongation factor SPT5 n=1 Tax=Coniophora puteana (strain RWD-64-598) TaxID=741705 RepID=A0A5M3MK58_CONPW|nr:transcription elongation factor Spt5 [Coniophora puteana RWD-64-598 SS2]EIW79602.1 transcription elongation factor Spt5 [Coniophora puteana RWD-64-598 SS2]